ncbi:hypothetical protein EN802_13495 [bacterium M00.F.Ca.ET.159.01.1.1]|nr:hypothetical protein EN802_13495 [bacterium M00.F.Ca.ET.159.01.1.1]
MEWDWNNVITLVGVGLGTSVAAYVGYFRKGAVAPPSEHVEIAGALVDSTAVKQLAAAIEAHTVEAIAQRLDAEKERQLGYRKLEAATRLIDELGELRHEVGDLAKEIARKR